MAELDEKKAPAAKEEKAKKPAKEKVSLGEKLGHFFRSYKSELKKIVWSPWKQVRKNSLVVFAVVIACAALICVLDIAFSQVIFKLGTLSF
jgi:preprotein translocase SecE subunit